MLQNYNIYKILQLFFDYPTKPFQLREISRLTKVSFPSVRNHIKKLEKLKFVKRKKGTIYEAYIADRNDKFLIYKRNDILIRLYESKLIDYLVDKLIPNTIVLFGSCARGEDIETSDIDLFIQAKEESIDLREFEGKLKRKINPLFESDIKDIPSELMNNIINGIVIYGYLKVLK